MLVGAGRQQPALVMRQAVAYKKHIVLLRRLAERLPELSLLVFDWSQDERWRIQSQTLRPLCTGRREKDAQFLRPNIKEFFFIINMTKH